MNALVMHCGSHYLLILVNLVDLVPMQVTEGFGALYAMFPQQIGDWFRQSSLVGTERVPTATPLVK